MKNSMSPSRVTLVSLALAGLVSISAVATSPANPMKKDDSSSSTELAPGFKWSFYNVAALTSAVLVVSAGFAAVMSFFFPIFIYKLCYILGSCPDSLSTYVDLLGVPPNSNLNSRRINKRSLEYIEPMLTTLAKAYEKYADDDLKKKFNKLTY